jgi:hypothetical protein
MVGQPVHSWNLDGTSKTELAVPQRSRLHARQPGCASCLSRDAKHQINVKTDFRVNMQSMSIAEDATI